MTIIDGTSGSMPARKCGFSSRNSPGCPALASMATRAPSHSLVAATPSIVRIAFGGTTVAIARVIEGQRSFLFCCSDLSPRSTLSGGVEADLNARNCIENASNPLVVSGHAQRMTNTSLKTAIDIAGVAPRPLNFPRGPLETCTLHDQKRLVSPARRCGNADLTFLGSVATRMGGSEAGLRPATSISGGHRMVNRKIGNPRAEKVLQRRSQILFT